jgi:hypothetical protein
VENLILGKIVFASISPHLYYLTRKFMAEWRISILLKSTFWNNFNFSNLIIERTGMSWISLCWMSFITHYFSSNKITVTYNIDFWCYILWVGIQHAPTLISPMFLVLVSSCIVWPTVFTINSAAFLSYQHQQLPWTETIEQTQILELFLTASTSSTG